MGRAVAIIVLLLILGALAVFWIYRGPSPPVDRIAATKQRAQETIARTEAHRYAPEAASQIQRSLDDVDGMVDTEQRKLPFQRRYDRVHAQLDNLDLQLENLESLAQANRQAMANALADEIAALFETAQMIESELGDMPTAKGSRSALGAMRSDLQEVRTAIEEAQTLQQQERYQQAQQKVAEAQNRADALLQEIRDIKERVRALRERRGS